MWIVKRCFTQTEQATIHLGEVVPLICILYAAELVIVYGNKGDCTVSLYISQESYSHFYLNHYVDKEVYIILHGKVDKEYFYHPDLDTALPEVMVSVMSTMTITTDIFMPTYPQGFFWSGTETWHV